MSIAEELKERARNAKPWNSFLLPKFSVLEYAPEAELIEMNLWYSTTFHCKTPDSGNMEFLSMFGNEEQKKQRLGPL